jgi:hypothetical protein
VTPGHAHERVICRHCLGVVAQCRCPSKEKGERWGVCRKPECVEAALTVRERA